DVEPGRGLAAELADSASSVYYFAGRFEDAAAAVGRARDIWLRTEGAGMLTAHALGELADIERELGKLDDALEHSRSALDLTERLLGPRHPYLAGSLRSYGGALGDRGDQHGARAAFARSLEVADNDSARILALNSLMAIDTGLG